MESIFDKYLKLSGQTWTLDSPSLKKKKKLILFLNEYVKPWLAFTFMFKLPGFSRIPVFALLSKATGNSFYSIKVFFLPTGLLAREAFQLLPLGILPSLLIITLICSFWALSPPNSWAQISLWESRAQALVTPTTLFYVTAPFRNLP